MHDRNDYMLRDRPKTLQVDDLQKLPVLAAMNDRCKNEV